MSDESPRSYPVLESLLGDSPASGAQTSRHERESRSATRRSDSSVGVEGELPHSSVVLRSMDSGRIPRCVEHFKRDSINLRLSAVCPVLRRASQYQSKVLDIKHVDPADGSSDVEAPIAGSPAECWGETSPDDDSPTHTVWCMASTSKALNVPRKRASSAEIKPSSAILSIEGPTWSPPQ